MPFWRARERGADSSRARQNGPWGSYLPGRTPTETNVIPSGPPTGHLVVPGVEADERAFAHGDLLAVDAEDPGAADDDGHLLLAGRPLVVLAALRAGSELEPVDSERLDSERPAYEAHRATRAGAVQVVYRDDGVAHGRRA